MEKVPDRSCSPSSGQFRLSILPANQQEASSTLPITVAYSCFRLCLGRTLWPKHTLYPKLPIRLGLEQTCVFKCQPGEIRFSDPKNTFPCIFSRQVSLPPPPPISFSALGRVPHFWTMHPLMDVCPGSFPPSTFCMIGLELSWNTWCLSPNPEVLSSSCDVAHLEGCIKSIFHKKHRKIHC